MKGKRLGRAESSRGEGQGARGRRRRRGAGRSAAGALLPWGADPPGTPAPELEPLGSDAWRQGAAPPRRAMRGCGAGAGPAVPPPLLLGLLLAAAPGAALGKETAFVEVVLFESSPSGDYTTYTTGLQGRFSRAGATLSAEGEIVQLDT